MKKLIDIPDDLHATAERYQDEKGSTFAWIARTALEQFFESEGFAPKSQTHRLDRIAELIKRSGLTFEEFEASIAQTLESKVCNG